MKQNQPANSALLRFPQVSSQTGLSRTKVTQLEHLGKFPKRIALGNRLVVWKESELQEFCNDPAGYEAGK